MGSWRVRRYLLGTQKKAIWRGLVTITQVNGDVLGEVTKMRGKLSLLRLLSVDCAPGTGCALQLETPFRATFVL